MSDELRPLDPDVEELLRAERGAAESDRAPAQARERVRSRVMVSVGLAAGAAAAGSASGAQAALLKAAPKLLSLPAKLVLCVAGATAIGLGAHAIHKAAHSPPPAHHARATPSSVAADVEPAPAAAPAPVVAAPAPVAAAPGPVAAPAPATPAPAAAAAPAAVEPPRKPAHHSDPDEALPAERELLEQGRAALGRGDSARALAAVARHQKRFPHGQLAEERESLWIRALVAAGEPDAARARAADFRARYPRSIFLPVVEATVKPLQ
jgi:hypothetical protein